MSKEFRLIKQILVATFQMPKDTMEQFVLIYI